MAIIIGQKSYSTAATTATLMFEIPPGASSTILSSSALAYVGMGTAATTANSFALPASAPTTIRAFTGSAGQGMYAVTPGTAVVSWIISTES